MSSRPLHAVMFPPSPGGGRFLEALAAALDGTGPAILPVDPSLPAAALQQMLEAFTPSAIETPEGTKRIAPPAPAPGSQSGVEPDIAVVIATSGSTGQPKGAQLTAAALRASAASSLSRIQALPGDRWLCCLPGFHVAGIQVLVRSLLAGSDPVIAGRADASVVADAIAAGCSRVSLVPTQLRRLLDAGAPLGAFGTILLGGAAAPASLLADARAAGARLVTTYGMSETCGGCVYDGLPLDGVRVAIGSDDGLIRIAGPVLFSGYRQREPGPPDGPGPRGSAGGQGGSAGGQGGSAGGQGGSAGGGPEGVPLGVPDGVPGGKWFRTSDLGSLAPDGRLTVRGRADDVINTGGEKVVPADVEAVLGTIDGVRDVVVVGIPDQEWGELVTAFVVPADPAAPPEPGRLRAHARGRLPGHAVPRRMLLVAEVPMLPSGKPDRQALRTAGLRYPEN